jgi:LysM repeat protein
MARMVRGWSLPFALAAALAVVAGAACGGGDDGPQQGAITDPATVPTVVSISQGTPVRYQIKDGVISTSGGSATLNTGGAATPAAGARTHTIASGEYCSTIAEKYGVTVDAIIKANRGINADCTNLRPGDVIRIPVVTPVGGSGGTGGAATRTPAAGGKTYVVQAGDTCSDIADAHGVDVKQLIALNGLSAACDDLDIGQVLRLP